MWSVAADVERWQREGSPAIVARAVSFEGFGGRRAGEVLAVGAGGERVGGLLGGSADEVVQEAVSRLGGGVTAELVEVSVGDAGAIAAGLACGGRARILVQDLAAVPLAFWACLAERRPAALVTVLEPLPTASVLLLRDGDEAAGAPSAAPDGFGDAVRAGAQRLLRGGREATELVEDDGGAVLVEAFVPATRLVVVGDQGTLTEALERQSALLGWDAELTDEAVAAATAVAALGPGDALVVLAHDHDLATPLLAAALGRECYVGALGSRRTQAVRQERLAAAGVDEDRRQRLHGPVGLDLGARAPEETALAICAEILAVRSGRDAASLRSGTGPVNG